MKMIAVQAMSVVGVIIFPAASFLHARNREWAGGQFRQDAQPKFDVKNYNSCGACRECLTEIGILLPTPDSLSEPLALAEAGKEGFLLKDMKKILRGRQTKFIFRSKG